MPAAAEGIFMMLLSSVDIIMVSQLGTVAVAAVSIFTQPRMMILTFSRSVGAALTLLTAEYFGEKTPEKICAVLRQTLFCGGICLLIIHGAFYFCLEEILNFMGASVEYTKDAMDYGKIALVAVFFTSVTAFLQGVMIGLLNTAKILKTNLLGNLLNIAASGVFIFLFDMGVKGAAFGTVAGTFLTLCLSVFALRHDKILRCGAFLPNRQYGRKMLSVFGGVFAESACERIGMVLYTRMVAELGVMAYAVHAVAMNFCDFYYGFAGGLGKASMALSGRAAGKKDAVLLKKYALVGMKWGAIFSAAAFIVTFMWRNEIFAFYLPDSQAIIMGDPIMIIVAAVGFAEAQSLIGAGILRGSGRTYFVALYSFVSVAVMRPLVTAAMLNVFHLGLSGAWLALAIDQTTRALCASVALFRKNFTPKI